MKNNENLTKRISNSFHKQEGLEDLLMMTVHPNGFMRENAVHRLGKLGSPMAIPKLIVRVNDWVPQVRKTARDALLMLMIPENATAFAESLPDLFHLRKCGRDDHSDFIDVVLDYLLQDENTESLRLAALSLDPKVARIAVWLCFDHSLLGRDELVAKCLSHPDVLVRNIAAGHLREISSKSLDALLKLAIKDPFMPIRREAFQIYLKISPEQGEVIANTFLFDRHISIRELAITHLLRKGADVKGIYSFWATSDSQSISRQKFSILGLAYLGAKEEIPSILQHLDNKSPGIRKSSIQALEKLLGDESKSILLAALKDPSPSVAKEASRLIAKLKLRFCSLEIVETINIKGKQHTLALATRAMKKSNKWERLIFLLRVLDKISGDKPSYKDMILSELEDWDADFNRSSSQPSALQIEMINQEYANCSYLLNERQRRSIEFTLNAIN